MAESSWEQARESALARLVEDQEREEQRKRWSEDPAFIEKAIRWLDERWGPHAPCPYCRSESWGIGSPFELPTTSGGALTPHFPVMCSVCGNTVFINAVLARVVEGAEWE